MNTAPQKVTSAWCWALIASEVIVVGYLAASFLLGPKARPNTGVLLSVLVFIATLFLFLGSPFLVRSQGWLAILGWCIAVSAFLFPVL
jgi:hypothetical protein